MNKMIIYKTTNLINYKIYIGQDSKNNPKYLGSGKILNKAIKKYSKENFRKDTLEYCSSIEELNKQEKFWIKLTRCQNPKIGYNIADGGYNGIVEETKEKIRKTLLGRKLTKEHKNNISKSLIGELNPFFGKQHTKESKIKCGQKNIGNKYWVGKHHTEETKEKIRKTLLGRKQSKETCEKKKIAFSGEKNPFFGKTHSKKTRKRLSLQASLQHAKRKNDLNKIKQLKEKLNEI